MDGFCDTLGFGMFSTEDRWERIASLLFWTGWIFVAMTAYGIYSRDDWRGVVMTAAPGGVLFALWWLARARAEYLLTHAKQPKWLTVASTLVIVAGAAALVWQWSHPRIVYVPDQDPHQALLRVDTSDLEVVEKEFTMANGEKAMLKSLSRKKQPTAPKVEAPVPPTDPTLAKPEGCEDWVREPDSTGEMIGYCARWATPSTSRAPARP